ncbi:hypothetical protein X975_12342, partial [Stegodyphus mimosarum]
MEVAICCSQENGRKSNDYEVKLLKTYIASVAAFLYVIVSGMMATFSSPAIVDMQKPGSRFIHITEDQISWIASLPSLTAAVGNILSGEYYLFIHLFYL